MAGQKVYPSVEKDVEVMHVEADTLCMVQCLRTRSAMGRRSGRSCPYVRSSKEIAIGCVMEKHGCHGEGTRLFEFFLPFVGLVTCLMRQPPSSLGSFMKSSKSLSTTKVDMKICITDMR